MGGIWGNLGEMGVKWVKMSVNLVGFGWIWVDLGEIG
jgi:hypothetical protein